MLDLCTQGLLDHVRLSTGVGPPNSSLLVESESESPWYNMPKHKHVEVTILTFGRNLVIFPSFGRKFVKSSNILINIALFKTIYINIEKNSHYVLHISGRKCKSPQIAYFLVILV